MYARPYRCVGCNACAVGGRLRKHECVHCVFSVELWCICNVMVKLSFCKQRMASSMRRSRAHHNSRAFRCTCTPKVQNPDRNRAIAKDGDLHLGVYGVRTKNYRKTGRPLWQPRKSTPGFLPALAPSRPR